MTYREFLARFLTIVLVVVLLVLLWQLRSIVLLIFLSSIIAVTLSIPVQFLRQMGVWRGPAIALTVFGTFGVLFLLATLILPETIRQTSTLIQELPDSARAAADEYAAFRASRDELQTVLPEFNVQEFEDAMTVEADEEGEEAQSLITFESIQDFVLPVLTRAGNFIVGAAANVLIIFIVALYLLIDPMDYVRGGLMLIPRNYQRRFLEIMSEVQRAVVAWLFSLTLSITVTVVLVYVGLGLVLGLPNALGLGVIAGLATIIPNIGSIIPLIPITIFTLATDPEKIIFAIPIYLLIQQIESSIITPRIVKENLNIPAGVTMVFQLIAAGLFGFLGILLAVPILAVIITLVREIYVYDMLGFRGVYFDLHQEADGDIVAVEVPAPPPGEKSILLNPQKRLAGLLTMVGLSKSPEEIRKERRRRK